jgi:superfamily I DNA/RNA helicase
MIFSQQQNQIFDFFREGKGNLVVVARAGCAKTTTVIEGIKHSRDNKIILCAFNKNIAEELKNRIDNPRAEAKTLHSIGFKFVCKNWNGVLLDGERGEKIAREICGNEAPDVIVRNVTRLTSLAKGMAPIDPQIDVLTDIAYEFNLQPDEDFEDDGWNVERIAKLAIKCMVRAAIRDGSIDFDDMIFVPLRNKWCSAWYDLVVVDEAQDMNASQLMLAQKICKKNGRIVIVGDDRQSIYGFRGADSNAINRMKTELRAKELFLTTTYRCPKLIVAAAQVFVPDFTAAPEAPGGIISSTTRDKIPTLVEVGDFVLSRKNAPLASICLAILRTGKRATIRGKDIGKGLIALVKKIKGKSMPDFLTRLTKWEDREVHRMKATGKKSAEARIEFIIDQAETLRELSSGLAGLKELEARIEQLFTETPGTDNRVVMCSSVHKAKGLETNKVFVLDDTFIKNGKLEEQNIEYVAITRAKCELVRVTIPIAVDETKTPENKIIEITS